MIFASIIFILSITIAVKSALDFIHYLDENEDDLGTSRPDIDVYAWRSWTYVNFSWAVIISIIVCLFLYKQVISS